MDRKEYLKNWREKNKEYMKDWREKNKEKSNGYSKTWRENNKENVQQNKKNWKKENPDKVSASKRKDNLKAKYGLSVAEYDAMLRNQGGGCAVCGKNGQRRLAVDHDHATGKIRGLLCVKCNIAIGNANDDPALLQKMRDYLRR